MRRPFLALALAVCLHAPSGAQDLPRIPAAPPGGAPPQQDAGRRVSIVPEVADDAIASRLRTIMETTERFEELSVDVRNGVVFLDGLTPRQEHREWARELAESLQGTVAVVNRLEVQQDADAAFGRAWQELRDFSLGVLSSWPVALVAALILVASWLAAKLVGRTTRRALAQRIPSTLLLTVATRAIAVSVFLLGLYFVLRVAGLTNLAVTVLGGTGLFGIIMGFAFRDIAENFLASLLLSMRNPFRSGDLIEVDGRTGIVQNLNTRSTVLLSLEGTHIQIPNATIYKSTIINYSSNASRRAEFVVGIGYESSVAKAQSIIATVLKEHPAVLDTPEPLVLVDELGPASVNLRVFYWFDTATYSPAKINSAVLRLSKNALLRAGIELPDPAREIIFPRGVPVIQTEAPPRVEEAEATPALAGEDTGAATMSEGGLSNETREVSSQAGGRVPEAGENLLKP